MINLKLLIIIALAPIASSDVTGGMLYPRESESRQIQELNGMWNFRADFTPGRNEGFDSEWWKRPLRKVQK